MDLQDLLILSSFFLVCFHFYFSILFIWVLKEREKWRNIKLNGQAIWEEQMENIKINGKFVKIITKERNEVNKVEHTSNKTDKLYEEKHEHLKGTKGCFFTGQRYARIIV